MLEHLSRLFKHSVVYGMAETVSRGISFILIFIYVRVLTEADLGIRTAVYVVGAFLGIFYTLGLDNAFLRYFMDEDSIGKKEDVFTTAFYFSALTGIIFLAVSLFFGEPVSRLMTKSGSYEYITRLLFVILIFDAAAIYPTLVLRAENRLKYYSFVAFARFSLFIGLNLVLVWILGRGLKGVFEANLIAVIIISLLMLPLYRTYLRGNISFSILKRMLSFGLPTIFTLLCMRIIDLSDRQLILRLLGENAASELGGYSVAYTLGMVGVMVFVHSFRIAWQPFFLSLKDNSDSRNIFSRVATYYSMFIGMVFLGIALFRREIFMLYAPKLPVSLAGIVPYVSFSYIFFGFYIIMMAGIFIREKTRYLPVVTFTAAALNLGLNFIFIPAFGIIGAAYTTVIAYITMVIIMYVISSKIYMVVYDFKRLGVVLLLTALPLGLSFVFQPEKNVLSIFYRGMLFLIPPAVYLFSNFLLPEERSKLKQVLRLW